MTGFEVDPAALHRRAAEFGDHAQQAGGIHRELAGELDTAGQCWGDDAVGQSFAAGHAGAARETLDRLSELAGQLGEVGDRFRETAGGYEQVERDNAAGFTPRGDG